MLSEVHLLLWSGGLIVSANHLAFLLQKEEFVEENSYFGWYFIGSCSAYAAAGIYHDLISNKKMYFTLVALNIVGISVQGA